MEDLVNWHPADPPPRLNRLAVVRYVIRAFALAFAVFAIGEVNLFAFAPFQERAIFLLCPLALCFLIPRGPASQYGISTRLLDYALAASSVMWKGLPIAERPDPFVERPGHLAALCKPNHA